MELDLTKLWRFIFL